jgi:cellobiose phosphorylase
MSLLGIESAGDKAPNLAVPARRAWKGFKFRYRHGEATFEVTVSQSADAGRTPSVRVDGTLQSDNSIPLAAGWRCPFGSGSRRPGAHGLTLARLPARLRAISAD